MTIMVPCFQARKIIGIDVGCVVKKDTIGQIVHCHNKFDMYLPLACENLISLANLNRNLDI